MRRGRGRRWPRRSVNTQKGLDLDAASVRIGSTCVCRRVREDGHAHSLERLSALVFSAVRVGKFAGRDDAAALKAAAARVGARLGV